MHNASTFVRESYTSLTMIEYNFTNYKKLCQTKLDSLKQTKSAASYAVEFATLAATQKWIPVGSRPGLTPGLTRDRPLKPRDRTRPTNLGKYEILDRSDRGIRVV